MQSKDKLRTGSMAMTMDAERDVSIENRVAAGDELWALYIPNENVRWEPGATLRAGHRNVLPLTFVKLEYGELSDLKLQCGSKRCTIVVLPKGLTPKDLNIQSR